MLTQNIFFLVKNLDELDASQQEVVKSLQQQAAKELTPEVGVKIELLYRELEKETRWGHMLEADDQWLYLPALKRVKRISSKNKSGPFMGSEFAFEDLSSREVAKFSYLYLRDEVINGEEVFVVESKPNYKYSGYTRLIAWISKEKYQPLKIEYYDRKNTLLKTTTATGYQQYMGKYWRPDSLNTVNHQTKKETRLDFSNYEFQKGLSDRDFDKSSLKGAR